MSKPTTAHNPQEQFKLERKRFEKNMRPKPVLAEKIERARIKSQKQEEKSRKYFEEL